MGKQYCLVLLIGNGIISSRRSCGCTQLDRECGDNRVRVTQYRYEWSPLWVAIFYLLEMRVGLSYQQVVNNGVGRDFILSWL